MPLWAITVIAIGIILLLAAVIAGIVLAIRNYERRSLLKLFGKAENIDAAIRTLEETLASLSVADDAVLEHFAEDVDSLERRVLDELASRMRVLADELDHTPEPTSLIGVAEALADSAYLVAHNAGRVGDEYVGETALGRLGDVDLASIEAYQSKARAMLVRIGEDFGVEETAVYGGGLYL